MNAVVEFKEAELPGPVARRGIHEAQWRTLMNNLYPGAKSESVLMVWDYCKARNLDPLKKPCHIVPMKVGAVWRDVVMAGIYEYRTTATRTGLYMGHTDPEFGPIEECAGVMAPAWCKLTVRRWNPEAKMIGEYPATIYFSESVATKDGEANSKWRKSPRQMLEKCTEAAALRKAFPDEFGGTHTAEEMEGQNQTDGGGITQPVIDVRPDTSSVDWELRDRHINSIVDILNLDKEEFEIAQTLRDYVEEHLNPFHELYITVLDKLAADKIISKANFNKYLKIGQDRK